MIDSVFPPALALLLRMQVRGRLRKITRGARTVKGKLYLREQDKLMCYQVGK